MSKNVSERVDRRIQRTQHALMNALITLSLEKGYDAVTIREITERADISYSTFFRHYASKDDLLASEVKARVHDLKTTIMRAHDKSTEAEGALIFRQIATQPAFYRVLFSSYGTSRVLQAIQQEIAADLVTSSVFPPAFTIPPEIAANHFVVTILNLIRWWLDHDMPYSPERMASIYSRLIIRPAP